MTKWYVLCHESETEMTSCSIQVRPINGLTWQVDEVLDHSGLIGVESSESHNKKECVVHKQISPIEWMSTPATRDFKLPTIPVDMT